MDSKYCSSCIQRYPISSFLLDAANPASRQYASCIRCQDRKAKSSARRKALGLLDANIPSKGRVSYPESLLTDSKNLSTCINLSTGPNLSTLSLNQRFSQPERLIQVTVRRCWKDGYGPGKVANLGCGPCATRLDA
jgi:hypothetical protein